MLSDYERRILNELEVELRRPPGRLGSLLCGLRLPVAALALCALVVFSPMADVKGAGEKVKDVFKN